MPPRALGAKGGRAESTAGVNRFRRPPEVSVVRSGKTGDWGVPDRTIPKT